jgi:hypothetical protein
MTTHSDTTLMEAVSQMDLSGRCAEIPCIEFEGFSRAKVRKSSVAPRQMIPLFISMCRHHTLPVVFVVVREQDVYFLAVRASSKIYWIV